MCAGLKDQEDDDALFGLVNMFTLLCWHRSKSSVVFDDVAIIFGWRVFLFFSPRFPPSLLLIRGIF